MVEQKKIKCPICKSDMLRKSRVGNFWYLTCWKCKRKFSSNRLFELTEIGESDKSLLRLKKEIDIHIERHRFGIGKNEPAIRSLEHIRKVIEGLFGKK